MREITHFNFKATLTGGYEATIRVSALNPAWVGHMLDKIKVEDEGVIRVRELNPTVSYIRDESSRF